MEKIGARIARMGRDLVASLERESPSYRALREGEMSRDQYLEFLVQHYKYARGNYEMMKAYARSMGEATPSGYGVIAKGAERHAEEEKGHDDGILADIATLWDCTPREALARVESMPSAPGVELYLASVATTLAKFPCAIAGLAIVLESVAESVARVARDNIVARPPFPGAERAIRFLSDHSDDGDHVQGGRLRVDLLEGVHHTLAARTLAAAIAVYYREIWRFIDALHAPEPETLMAAAR